MHEIPSSLQALMVGGRHCWATLWKIERTDGVIFRFTDHNEPLSLGEEVFTPSDAAISATARQHIAGTDPQNLDIRGAITNNTITDDDLRAGKFRQAKITERLVDWRFPWQGQFLVNVYYVEEATFNKNRWLARLAGMTVRLRPKVGRKATRSCSWKFGDPDTCGLNIADFTTVGREVTSVVTDRKKFGSNVVGANTLYSNGLLIWTSGDNVGVRCPVKSHTNPGGIIDLQVQTPFSTQSGDLFDLQQSCAKTMRACTTFNNVLRYGGFPDIPGNDRLIQIPST